MGIVSNEFKSLICKIVDVPDCGVYPHLREGAAFAGELKSDLLHMVGIDVQIAESVNEFAGFETAHLGYHHGKERIGGDIKGYSKEEVGASLVELAAELLRFRIYVELKEGVTGC